MENTNPITFHSPFADAPGGPDGVTLAILAVIALVMVIVLVRVTIRPAKPVTHLAHVTSPPSHRKQPCKWHKARVGHTANLTKYSCRQCGAEAFATTARPPRECKSALRELPL